AVLVQERLDADDRIQLEQCERGCRIVEIYLAGRNLLLERLGQGIGINLEADRQRGLWRDAGTDATILFTGHRLVQLQRIAPEGLAAERVVAKGILALIKHGTCVLASRCVVTVDLGRGR